uniref:C2 domain-containing protein n=1 Tax=Salix viminalis TaxID=40686 RepID=A0A6N2K224_SALVM
MKSGTDGADGLNSGRTSPKKNVIVRGVLTVTVIAAEDLPATDLNGKADPYVVLVMKKSEKKVKTRVLTKNLNPVWNQTFEFVVEDALHDMKMHHDTHQGSIRRRISRQLSTRRSYIRKAASASPVDTAAKVS